MAPNPIKYIGALMNRVRSAVEPALVSAGFIFDGRNKRVHRSNNPMWLDCTRADMLFRISYLQNEARLREEIIDSDDGYRAVVTTYMNRPESTGQLMARIDLFTSELVDFLRELPPHPSK